MLPNFHLPKWAVYAGIVVFCLVLVWFLLTVFSNTMLRINHEKVQQIEGLKQDSHQIADSLTHVIANEKTINAAQIESLAKRVEKVKVTAKQQTQNLISNYAQLFKQVDSLTDDSISIVYRHYRCKPEFDSILSK